jgi:hypothetical protein
MIELTLTVYLLGQIIGVYTLPDRFEEPEDCLARAIELIERRQPEVVIEGVCQLKTRET